MKHFENKLLKSILTESEQQMDKSQRDTFLKTVANFKSIGESVYGSTDLQEVVSKISEIVEQAEVLTMQESEHWFDNVTVSRHMKQLKEAYNGLARPEDGVGQARQGRRVQSGRTAQPAEWIEIERALPFFRDR